jgi:hypothetical protein
MARLTTFTIEGEPVAADRLRDLTFAIDEQLNGRSNVECRTVDPASDFRPTPLDELVVGLDDVELFGGILWDHKETDIGGPGTGIDGALVFIDKTALTDVVYFNGPIEAGSLLFQLSAFMPNMGPHGVTLSPDQETGPTLAAQTFAFLTIRECLDSLAQQATAAQEPSWIYTINAAGELLMFQPGSITAPFTISEDEGNYRSLEWVRNVNTYRNEGWARYGSSGVQVTTEVFEGDGANRTYPLARALVLSGGLATPSGFVTVTRAGPTVTTETIDLGGSAEWHYDSAQNALIHDAAEPALLDGETISIDYSVSGAGLEFYRHTAEYAEFGPWTLVLDYPDVTNPAVALALITAEVHQRIGFNKRVTLVIDEPGIRPGMILPMEVPSRACEGDFLVLGVRTVEEAIQPTDDPADAGERFFRFELDLIEGNVYRTNWRAFWGIDPGSHTGGPGLTPVPITPPADYPQVRSTNTGRTTSDTTTHAIGLPTHVAGDLLLTFFSNDNNSTVTIDGSSTAGWAELATGVGTTNLVRGSVFWKVADDAATTLTLTTSAAQQSSWINYAITVGTFSGVDASVSTGGGINSDPPNHVPSPGGTPNYLWIVARCGDSEFVASAAPSTPVAFGNMLTQAGTISGASTNTARAVVAASSLNPGAWTSGDNVSWVCFTVAVWPD